MDNYDNINSSVIYFRYDLHKQLISSNYINKIHCNGKNSFFFMNISKTKRNIFVTRKCSSKYLKTIEIDIRMINR